MVGNNSWYGVEGALTDVLTDEDPTFYASDHVEPIDTPGFEAALEMYYEMAG